MNDLIANWEWHDWWRLLNVTVCGVCVYLLLDRFRTHKDEYNAKTIDIWYAFVAWTATGFISSIEGIARNNEVGVRVLCVSVAGIVTLSALSRKGAWGYPDA